MPVPDLKDYNKKAAKGLSYVRDTGDKKNFAIVSRRFDPADGTELASGVLGVTLDEVNVAIAETQAQLDALKAFQAELSTAKAMDVMKAK